MLVQEFDSLWAEFARDFAPLARKRVGDELAEDAMQDAYLRARRLLPGYQHQDRRAFFGWAIQILLRVCSETRRRESRHTHDTLTTPLLENLTAPTAQQQQAGVIDGDPAAAALEAAGRADDASELYDLIGRAELSAFQRTIIAAHVAGEPPEQTAHRFATSEANIRAHLSCAIEELRATAYGSPAFDFNDANV